MNAADPNCWRRWTTLSSARACTPRAPGSSSTLRRVSLRPGRQPARISGSWRDSGVCRPRRQWDITCICRWCCGRVRRWVGDFGGRWTSLAISEVAPRRLAHSRVPGCNPAADRPLAARHHLPARCGRMADRHAASRVAEDALVEVTVDGGKVWVQQRSMEGNDRPPRRLAYAEAVWHPRRFTTQSVTDGRFIRLNRLAGPPVCDGVSVLHLAGFS